MEETEDFCNANNHIAPMTLRVNLLNANPSSILNELRMETSHVDPSPYLPEAIRITGLRRDISQTDVYRRGDIQIQDEASQMISYLTAPLPGERVLDLCAGFGAKATHLGVFMQNSGKITAVDQASWKLEQLAGNAQRQGIDIIGTVSCDALELSPHELGMFDRVLVDAPCSGFGALRRNPDIKWARHPKDPYRFSVLQKSLLEQGARFVKKGGVLVYATCTVFSEENESTAQHFSSTHPQYHLESLEQSLPSACHSMLEGLFFKSWPHRHDIDGFFACRWRREEE
jgi:16S rRNA (cytosine967-C5)-methyltransferase